MGLHAAVTLCMSFVYRAEGLVAAAWASYAFLALDCVCVSVLLFGRHIASVAVATWVPAISIFGWLVTVSFIASRSAGKSTASLHYHICGVVMWGLVGASALPAPNQLPRHVFHLVYELCVVAVAASGTTWRPLVAPSCEDWYLVGYLLVPVTVILIALEFQRQLLTCLSTVPEDKSIAFSVSEAQPPVIRCSSVEGKLPRPISQSVIASRPPATSQNLVANLAHEVRTPLNALLSCCTLLADTQLNSEQLEFVNIMMTCGSQITNNINFVLDLAKLEQGKLVLEQKSFDLQQICQECLHIVFHLAEQKQLELRLVCENESGVACVGDASRLKQALLNLLTNSIKFTEKGEVVVTILGPTPIPNKLASSSRLSYRIEITDTGIGMSEEQQKRLFQPFEQASNETYGKYGGTGLGLVISKQLIELMHGTLTVDRVRTSPGKGSTFVLTVPAPPTSVDGCSASSIPPSPSVAATTPHNGDRQALVDGTGAVASGTSMLSGNINSTSTSSRHELDRRPSLLGFPGKLKFCATATSHRNRAREWSSTSLTHSDPPTPIPPWDSGPDPIPAPPRSPQTADGPRFATMTMSTVVPPPAAQLPPLTRRPSRLILTSILSSSKSFQRDSGGVASAPAGGGTTSQMSPSGSCGGEEPPLRRQVSLFGSRLATSSSYYAFEQGGSMKNAFDHEQNVWVSKSSTSEGVGGSSSHGTRVGTCSPPTGAGSSISMSVHSLPYGSPTASQLKQSHSPPIAVLKKKSVG